MRMLRRLLLVPAALLAAACADAKMPTATPAPEAPQPANTAAQQAPSPNIVDVVLQINAETGEFSTLLAAVTSAGLVDALAATGQRTVFAPTDAAFAELGLNPGNVGTLPAGTLTGLLLYHVAPERRDAASVLASSRIRMANGQRTNIRIQDGVPYINNARIVQTDVEATNGIIHVIDAVLLRTASAPSFVDLLLQANAQSGEFSTLIAAVVAADLVGPLSSQGQGTIFAPTDAAFASLGLNADNVGSLPKSDLLNILGYHTAPGRYDAASVIAAGELRMANGQLAQITVEDGMVYIENARILVTDIAASNGIVHVIDAVLLP
ncbi:hypothetical protein BH23GEM7_BH23GEM7_18600 [soil metagenome]